MDFFGELYLRSTAPFLSPEMTAREVAYLVKALPSPGWILDIGCGQGRHATGLARDGRFRVVGLELDQLSLRQRRPGFEAIRGDFRQMPFKPASIGAAYAWYSTLFIHSDPVHRALLGEIRRVLAPGGSFIFHSTPFERLAAQPSARFAQTLPGGGILTESSQFDPVTGVDEGHRRLVLPDGRTLEATYRVRYYRLPDLRQLFESAGFSIRWVHGSLEGDPLGPSSTELIVGATSGAKEAPWLNGS